MIHLGLARFRVTTLVWAVGLGLQMAAACPVAAGELRPSVPPHAGGPSASSQQRVKQPDAAWDYDQFRSEVARLSQQQKNALTSGLQKKLKDAVAREDYAAVAHYSRLLHIVDGRKGRD